MNTNYRAMSRIIHKAILGSLGESIKLPSDDFKYRGMKLCDANSKKQKFSGGPLFALLL